MSAIISALQLMFPPHTLFVRFCVQPLSLSVLFPPSLFLSPSVTQQRVASVNQAGPFSFRRALISADDVSKEVKGTTERPQQLLSPIHRLQIYVSLSLFFPLFLPHSRSLSYHIFNIINIDRAVHLEPLFNNWLPRLIRALMVSAGG